MNDFPVKFHELLEVATRQADGAGDVVEVKARIAATSSDLRLNLPYPRGPDAAIGNHFPGIGMHRLRPHAHTMPNGSGRHARARTQHDATRTRLAPKPFRMIHGAAFTSAGTPRLGRSDAPPIRFSHNRAAFKPYWSSFLAEEIAPYHDRLVF